MRTRSAKSTQTALQLPALPAPTRSARLPPEIISHIQACAEEDQAPGEIKKLRATFELVNKEWYGIVDHFTHVVVTQLSDVTRLTTKLRSSKLRALLAAKTRSISLVLNGVERSGEARKVCALLRWISQAECVYIEAVGGVFLTDFATSAATSVLSAVQSFKRLRHFTFRHNVSRSGSASLVSPKRLKE